MTVCGLYLLTLLAVLGYRNDVGAQLGGSCTDGSDCTDDADCKDADVCACPSGYYNDESTCKQKIPYDGVCIANSTCLDVSTDCFGGRCLCDPRHYRNRTSSACASKIPYDGVCIANSTCLDVSTDCFGGRCLCDPRHYRNRTSSACASKIPYDGVCIANSTCLDVSTDCFGGRCLCDPRHYRNRTSSACASKIPYDGVCIANSTCLDVSTDCFGGRCLCDPRHYRNRTSSACASKIPYDGVCIANSTCLDVSTDCFGGRCLCDPRHYRNRTSSACASKIPYDGVCIANSTCLDVSTDCFGGRCLCDPRHYRNRTSSACASKIPYDGVCIANSTCLDVSTDCFGGRCLCDPRHYRNRTSSACASKIPYDGVCIANSTCLDVSTDCFGGRCLCDPRHYRNRTSSACASIADLKPLNVHKDTVGTKNFNLQWTQPVNDEYVTGYRVDVKPIDTNDPDPPPQNATGPPISVQGLQPGTQYDVTVSSMIQYAGRVEYAPAAKIKISTKPETVVSLNEGHSNLTFPTITIAFRPVSKRFTSYTLNLEGKNGYNKTETATTNIVFGKTFYRAQFSGVVAGEYYNLTIITVSGTVKSEPFIQRIRIMAAQAGTVNHLKTLALTSRSVSVSWKRPEKTNGDLFEYRLEVLNRTCKQLIVFNCTECKRNTSMEASGNCEHTTVVPISASDINDTTHVVNYTITGLLPDTTYVVKVAAYNQEGRGMERSLSETTDEEAASEPTAFTANNKTSDTITLTWAPPEPRPGRTHYNIRVYEKIETTPDYNYIDTKNITGYRHNMYTVNNLSSAWEYKFFIHAFTQEGGSGNVSSGVVMTKESAPTEAVQYNVTRIPNVYNHIKLSWRCPKKKDGRNGIIKSSTLIYHPNQTSTIYPKRRNETYKNTNNCTWEQAVEVTPEYSYSFTVFLQNTYPGSQSTINQYIEAGPPDISIDSVNAPTASDSQTSVTLNICGKCLRDDKNGKVTETGLLVCVNPPCDAARERMSSTAFSYDEYTNWHTSKNGGFKVQYRTTSDDWDYGHTGTGSFEYVVGNENCDLEPSTDFCNGLLPQGSTLQVTPFACTGAGCAEGSPVEVKQRAPDASPQYTLQIVGAATAVVVFVIIVVLVKWFFGRRRNVGKSARRLSTQGIQIGNVIANKRPIRMSEFCERVDDMHKDSNMQFSDEFEDIGTISPKHACAASETGGNKLRNRYVNILPFDHTRVKLRSLADDDEDDSDYINANYIPGYNSPREYIATQGPMTGTVADFWRMIWEQDVHIIIMLSDLLEKGKPKVDRYWPENINEPVQHGDIIVEMINYSPLNKYVIKIFKITKRNESRKVRHYFLPGWQDFGANLTSDDVISFVRDVRMTIKPTEKGPICVHCRYTYKHVLSSAGVGRTGTYVSLDVFKQAIDEENFDKELDVFDFVMRMRENRSYMVQTEKQYIFIYDTIKEMIIRKRKEIAERENIYQNSDNYPEENIYTNEGYEPGPEEMYMNV